MKMCTTGMATALLTGTMAVQHSPVKHRRSPGRHRAVHDHPDDARTAAKWSLPGRSPLSVRTWSNRAAGRARPSTFVFPNGTITLARTDNPGGTGDFNPVACVGHFTNSGTYVLTGGTGAYAGISGGGTYSTWGTVVAARTPSGCGDTPIAVFGVGRAQGPVSFS